MLAALNEEQRRAVDCGDGPILILAGAGSGKTRVLTHRIAYLIEHHKVAPETILAVTFTNKASQEMRERVSQLLRLPLAPPHSSKGLWIGTFHSICTRILRADAERLGFSRQFSIYDSEDQMALLRRVLEEMQIPGEQLAPAYARYCISRAKNGLRSAQDYASTATLPKHEIIAQVYERYQRKLAENNAMDFDDLLLYPLELFRRYPEVLAHYQNRFNNFLVDEFQDTNRVQYYWLKALAGSSRGCSRNLFVVGDDDQSIYRWRGADLRNILEFEADYPDCKIFRLEQNYRSTRNILEAAHSVIVNNKMRMEKKLWTEREAGERVQVLAAASGYHEAQIVFDKISSEFSYNGDGRNYSRSFRDFAVLYRTNVQSRLLEEVFRRHGIPYTIVGGLRFYERKEVKDILAYLRVVANPADSVSLLRIINYPLRGIGDVTIKKMEQYAREQKLTLFEALGRASAVGALSASLREKVAAVHAFINKYVNLKSALSLPELCNALVDETGIIPLLKKEAAQERIDNIRELLDAIGAFARETPGATIEGFLELVALITDYDQWDDKGNAVTLMTLHSAKGLEFPVVFITGLEEGLFPLLRQEDADSDLEEERRLFYVGATRAKEKLYLAYACERARFGNEASAALPSRFLEELASDFIEQAHVRRARFQEPEPMPEPDTIMPVYEDESQEVGMIRAGRWVLHHSFGRGRILSVEGKGEKMKVTVDFEDLGQKKIVVKYGNLRLI
ncbi:UvrD-helicase domain-containing protein [candidate division KSB1 bacterium]|nr:UvrD-helicase domain-containing protein [candidate division KSB1 bacterium]